MAIPHQESPAVVRARAVEIVDEKGIVRVKLGVFAEGPAVRIYDEHGRTRAWLGMSFLDQSQMIFYDQTTTRMCLGLEADGKPALEMLGAMTAHAAASLVKRWDEEAQQQDERDRVGREKRIQARAHAKKAKP